MSQISFLRFYFQGHQPFEFSQFHELSCCTHDMAKDIINYFKGYLIKKPTYDVLKLPLGCITINYWGQDWGHTERLNNVVSQLNELMARFKTCHHHLQVSNIVVYVYLTLQLMWAKVLPMKFWRWKFHASC